MAATEKLGPWEPGGGSISRELIVSSPPALKHSARELARRVLERRTSLSGTWSVKLRGVWGAPDSAAPRARERSRLGRGDGRISGAPGSGGQAGRQDVAPPPTVLLELASDFGAKPEWIPPSDEQQRAYDKQQHDFRCWWEEFIASPSGKYALDAFEAARRPKGRRTAESVRADLDALFLIARACYLAKIWREDGREGELRPLDRRKRLLSRIANRSERLARALREFEDRNALYELMLRSQQAAQVLCIESREQFRPVAERLAELLAALAERLKALRPQQAFGDVGEQCARLARALREHRDSPALNRELLRAQGDAQALCADSRPRVRLPAERLADLLSEIGKRRDSGPRRRTWVYGNMMLRRSVHPNNLPGDETMLGFELVMYLRRWSAGRDLRFYRGEGMPQEGKPHYEVAAAFACAALGLAEEPLSFAEDLRNRLKRLPAGVGLWTWPHDAAHEPTESLRLPGKRRRPRRKPAPE